MEELAINSRESSHDLLGVEDRIQNALYYLEDQIRNNLVEFATLENYNWETNGAQMLKLLNHTQEMGEQQQNTSQALNQVSNLLTTHYKILYKFSILFSCF